MAYSCSFGVFTCIQMYQLQQREALITSQSSTWDVIELIFKGRLSWVCRNFDRDYLYKVMHTFPDLNSILPVVVVVCHRGFVYWLYWKIRIGNWGSGMWDPFLGGRWGGGGVSIDRKICCLIFREKDDACNFYAHVARNIQHIAWS